MFEKNIKYLRLKKNWRQVDLSDRLGYKNFVTVHKWEANENVPPYRIIKKLCAIFDVSEHDLMYTDLEKRDLGELPEEEPSDSVRINVYSKIHAGIPIDAIDDVIDTEEISADLTTGGREYFGLIVHGDCMSPKYQEGDVIIVRKQEDCESGQDCVVYTNDYEAELKKVIKKGNAVILQPLNTKYEPRIYTGGVSIAGVVVEIRRKV